MRFPAVEYRIGIPAEIRWCRRRLMPHMLPISRTPYENACVAVTGEHDAHPPRIQMELIQVGEASKRMPCDRHIELETLKSIRRRDDYVRSSRRIEPRAYQRQL